MRNFFVRRWFLLFLVLVMGCGIGFSEPLRPLTAVPALRQAVVLVVMFLMAFPLCIGAIWTTIRRPQGPLLAIAITFGMTPLMAWGMCESLCALWPGFRGAMGNGILVAAAAPCTLASCSVWTRRAGGNDAVSLLVTMVTNLICFAVTPAWLLLMIGLLPQFDPLAMAVNLSLLVMLPVMAAQLLRLIPRWAAWATRHKIPLGVLAQIGVLVMVFLSAIQTGHRLDGENLATIWAGLAAMIVLVLVLHLTALFVGLKASRLIGVNRPDGIAVGFASSQKTSMVGLEVAAQLGVNVVPIVTYHISQLLVDTVVADRLREGTILPEGADSWPADADSGA